MTSFKKNLLSIYSQKDHSLSGLGLFVLFFNSFIEDIIHLPYSSLIQVYHSVFLVYMYSQSCASVTTFNFRTVTPLPRETPGRPGGSGG